MSLAIRAYARHRAAAGLPGATHSAVRAAIKAGRLTAKSVTKAGKIRSAKAADAEWAATTKSEMVPLTGPTAPGGEAAAPDFGVARARRETANASKAELELAELRKHLVDAREVETRIATVFHGCRTKLLGITARAAQRDPALSRTQLAMFDGLLREALESLADAAAEGTSAA